MRSTELSICRTKVLELHLCPEFSEFLRGIFIIGYHRPRNYSKYKHTYRYSTYICIDTVLTLPHTERQTDRRANAHVTRGMSPGPC